MENDSWISCQFLLQEFNEDWSHNSVWLDMDVIDGVKQAIDWVDKRIGTREGMRCILYHNCKGYILPDYYGWGTRVNTWEVVKEWGEIPSWAPRI